MPRDKRHLSGRHVLCFLFLVLFVVLTSYGKAKSAATEPPEMLSYRITGKDGGGEYTGSVVLLPDKSKKRARPLCAFRRTRHTSGGNWTQTYGTGTVMNGWVELNFGRPLLKGGEAGKTTRMTSAFKSAARSSISVSGRLFNGNKRGNMSLRSTKGNKIDSGEEMWTLEKQADVYKNFVREVALEKDQWSSIPLPLKKPGIVKVGVSKTVAPRGFFLPKGERIPKVGKIDHYDVLPPVNKPKGKDDGTPDIYHETEGAAWLKSFDEKDLGKEWAFYYRDEGSRAALKKRVDISFIDVSLFDFDICNPAVSVSVSPHEAAAGEPITITVDANAIAGLEMLWWFGNGTGITDLDKAHIASGAGQVTGQHTWTIAINTPGTYSFGANARDILYPEPGVPHQASEGCGLAYDSVVVRGDLRKSYTIAFVLLAPAGSDPLSPEFAGYLNRLDGIKAALPAQFATSTEGTGAVDASYPTVVLMPPGPVYGLYDDSSLMYEFVRSTIANYFYPSRPDTFDFLAVYEVYPDKDIGSRHYTVKTKVAGFGISPYDISSSWGSGGKLAGVGLVNDVRLLPDTYNFMGSDMQLLLHESFGHQWGVFANKMAKPGFHFDIGLESPNFTVLYGRPWRKIDETHFTTENVQDPATGTFKITFHPWILYIAGMKLRPEVPAVLMDVEPDTQPASRYDLVTTTGTYQNVTLQSVIDESGDRYDVSW